MSSSIELGRWLKAVQIQDLQVDCVKKASMENDMKDIAVDVYACP